MSRRALAVVARTLNAPVGAEEIEVESPHRGEVMIKVAATGVCHSDLSATNGTIKLPLPVILGHEASGTVVEVGEGVTEFAIGDHLVSSFVSMCGKCRYCATGRPQLCDQGARTLSSLPDGTLRTKDRAGNALNIFSGCGVMAEYATLHVDNCVKIRADMPLIPAALVSCGVMTGVGAVFNTAKVAAGSSVLVSGAGGVGLNAIQAAAIVGAREIIAVDITDEKLALARQFGATHTINASREENLVKTIKKLTDGGPDYCFECAGVAAMAETLFRAMRKGGTTVVVGVPKKDDTAPIRPAMAVFEEKTLTGSYFGSARPREDFPRLMSLYLSKRLKLDELITKTYRIQEAPQAFADLEAGKNARGVIVYD